MRRPSDVGLFGDLNGVVDFDAEIANGAGYVGMSEQKLNRTQSSGPPIDEHRFRRRSEWVPNVFGSSPILADHS